MRVICSPIFPLVCGLKNLQPTFSFQLQPAWSNYVFFYVNLTIGRNTGCPMIIFLMLTAERAFAEALPVEWTQETMLFVCKEILP